MLSNILVFITLFISLIVFGLFNYRQSNEMAEKLYRLTEKEQVSKKNEKGKLLYFKRKEE